MPLIGTLSYVLTDWMSRDEERLKYLKEFIFTEKKAQPVDFYILGPGLGILVEDELEGLMIKLLLELVGLRMGAEEVGDDDSKANISLVNVRFIIDSFARFWILLLLLSSTSSFCRLI